MGIRQAMGENRRYSAMAVTALFVVAVASIVYQVMANRPRGLVVPEYYYTTDEGGTWFSAPATLLPPFDHKGKPAVRAWVYQCSGKEFVAYLERFTDEARRLGAQAEQALQNAKKGDEPPPILWQAAEARRSGRQVKRPGDKEWVSAGSREGVAIMDVKCPAGMSGTPQLVEP
jgi:hypothetical protein